MSKLPKFVDPNGNCLIKFMRGATVSQTDRFVHGAADFVAFVNVCRLLIGYVLFWQVVQLQS